MNNNKTHQLVNDGIYHIISRSIARFTIFNDKNDYVRMIQLLRFYQLKNPPTKYSMFLRQKGVEMLGFDIYFRKVKKDYEKLVEIIAYCLMPNHIHLVLKQLRGKGISIFMKNILDSYTRYFNLLHKRKGPLWESRFKHILVETDEQLFHLTRYLHLNATSANLVSKPELWKYSSYSEYTVSSDNLLTRREGSIDISYKEYKKFVNDHKDYQQRLAIIKKIIEI
ncbi:MAG TPA: transposase [Patescibacteria group bacterium]|nr:transposase [Patescibacteria group bacterium]